MKAIKALTISFSLAIAGLLHAEETLFSQEFQTRIQGVSITTNRSLVLLDDGNYQYRLKSSNFLVKMEETSLFERLEDGSFRPLSNHSSRKILGISKESSTDFDWLTMRATYRQGDEVKETTLEKGMVDRTMYQYLMELDMRAGRPLLSYEVVDRGRVRNFTFENLGVEDIEIENEMMSAFKLRRLLDDEEEDRETLVWLSADLDYELVKIFHTDDGDDYTMTRKL